MKKVLTIITIIVLAIILVSCHKKDDENTNDETVDLTKLAYYRYLNDDNPVIIITVKDYGVMKLQLFPNVAPISVDNMIDYILDEAYKNSNFHRIIKDFMIQGGIVNNTYDPIIGEFKSNGITNNLRHTRGVLSMARTSDPNSGTSQFFIVHKTSNWLDGEYAAFGGLINGFDVLDKIATVKTNSSDAPLNKIIISNIKLETK